jgi:hypothetical protein
MWDDRGMRVGVGTGVEFVGAAVAMVAHRQCRVQRGDRGGGWGGVLCVRLRTSRYKATGHWLEEGTAKHPGS